MDSRTVVIVGAGVVGCAIAAEAARHFSDVYLIERMPRAGMLTSTRNSGVIHSGIYYAAGSRKAWHCVRGNTLMREFCEKHSVPWRASGKLVIASSLQQISSLEELQQRGIGNGVEGLELIDAAAVRTREPHIRAAAALWVPSAAILNAESLVHTLLRIARERGAEFVAETALIGVDSQPHGRLRLHTSTGDFDTDVVINAAGLYADEVAHMFGESRFTIYPVRGEYCYISRRLAGAVQGLVYPLPTPLSLGIHLTRTVDDTLLLGPTARYVNRKDDYESDLLPPSYFFEQTRDFLPELKLEDLRLAYTGLRPKLVGPESHNGAGDPARQHGAHIPTGDFIVERDPCHDAVIHLIGIDSPGLTSALSLAEETCDLLGVRSAVTA